MVTPASIVPEWYLLPFYAILRSIPNKLLGVVAMFGSLLILLVLPFTDLSRTRSNQFRPAMKLADFYLTQPNLVTIHSLAPIFYLISALHLSLIFFDHCALYLWLVLFFDHFCFSYDHTACSQPVYG